jgi:hypothetical protein
VKATHTLLLISFIKALFSEIAVFTYESCPLIFIKKQQSLRKTHMAAEIKPLPSTIKKANLVPKWFRIDSFWLS